MNHTNEGSKLYLYSITSVAILGGLLFGYDTAVISGAEKGLEAFFLTATDFQYDKVMHGITSSSALIGCVHCPASSLHGWGAATHYGWPPYFSSFRHWGLIILNSCSLNMGRLI